MQSVFLRPHRGTVELLIFLIKWKGELHWEGIKGLSVPREKVTTSVDVRFSGSGHSCRGCLHNVMLPNAEIRSTQQKDLSHFSAFPWKESYIKLCLHWRNFKCL